MWIAMGTLDLYVTNFGEPNRLYRNDGTGFTDIAPIMGVDDPRRRIRRGMGGLRPRWGPGSLRRQFCANRFYQNNGNGFVERADTLGLGDVESGIQPAWGRF